MVRERIYQDSELARRLEEWLVEYFKRIDLKNSRHGSTVFFANMGIEYAAVFCQESGKRMFCFHVESYSNDLIDDMEKGLINDSIFDTHEVLSRPKYRAKLKDCRKIFRREYVKLGELYVADQKIMSAVSAVRIKTLPFGVEGRLSGNFSEFAFDYNIRPVIILSQKHYFGKRD